MQRRCPFLPDWRDAAAYAPLQAADRGVLAWEWLRRVDGYRAAAHAAARHDPRAAGDWGLVRFESPDVAAPKARPLWTAAAYDAVLLAAVIAGAQRQRGADLARLGAMVTVVRMPACEHLLLSDGWRAIRLDLEPGAPRAGPAQLVFRLEGPPRLAAPLRALRQLEALLRRRRFVRALHPSEPRARREVLLLRTADALADGATQRAIAAALLHPAAARPGWRDERPELRLQAQRLVRDARERLQGGYRDLLRRPRRETAQP
jgi:hypothetical protein